MVLTDSPFHKERLAYADGSILYGAFETPLNPATKTGRAFVEVRNAVEGAECLRQIDEFEEAHPTLPGDEEEAAIKAHAIRSAALRTLLPLLDVNGDGHIDRDELKNVMPNNTDEEIEAILQSMDLDGDGRVTAEEWVEGVLAMHQGASADEFVEDTKRMREYLEAPFISAINELFVAADKDDSGMLDIFEVTAVLYKMAGPGKGPKLDKVMADFDADGNHMLDYDEFKKLYTTLVEQRVIPRPRP